MNSPVNGLRVLLAIALLTGVAQAQTVQGVKLSGGVRGTSAAANEGDLTASANIASILQFTILDADIQCGTVSVTGAVTNCTDDANITIESNANWGITINDGLMYDSDPSFANYSLLTHDDPASDGSFRLDLAASNGATGLSNLPPAGGTIDVSITGSIPGTGSSVDALGYEDFYGTYTGYFVVVLFEDP